MNVNTQAVFGSRAQPLETESSILMWLIGAEHAKGVFPKNIAKKALIICLK